MKLKDKIIEASVKLFNENGSHSVTTNHIKDTLNISPGTLYYHFKNKEEIVRHIFKQIIEEFTMLFGSTDGHLTPQEFIGMVEAMYALLYKYRFFYTDIAMLLQRDPELKKLYAENRKNRYTAQDSLYKTLIESKIICKIESEGERRCVFDNLWMITDFYFAYTGASQGRIKQTDIKKGLQHYIVMMKPYITKKAMEELNQYIP